MPSVSLHDLNTFPSAATLVDVRQGTSLSRDELLGEVRRRAQSLREAGVEAGSSVVVGQASAVDYIVDLFALWSLGAMAVAVEPNLTASEQSLVAESVGALLWRGEDRREIGSTRPEKGSTTSDEGDALVLLTSGTTGRPKGVVHSCHSLNSRIEANLQAIGPDDLANTLLVLPIHFGHGLIGNTLTALAAGGTVHLWPGPSVAEMKEFPALVDNAQMSFMSSVPAFWRIALRVAQRPARSFARVHVGSAPLSAVLWGQIADWCGTRRVFNMYGMSEAANWIAGASIEDNGGDGFVGRPWGGAFAVLDGSGAISPSGSGEVLVRSPSMMSRYFGLPQETAATFVDGWLKTGDIGQLAADGNLTLVGRSKSEINRAGAKILAEEIDMLLEHHPLVVEACAFGMPDAVAGEVVAAAVVAREPGLTEDDLRAWCRERCRRDAVPARLFFFDSLPRNDRGKVSRIAVRERALGSVVR
ncbi:acyl--CoA ligase [Starkeya sp. ORNL1]|uniref:class I adenylate-forming enzyme family protein n=1 Tax=Starkeya sp. ORNL1 TaxID=2709380 RepID=UPI0014643B15|nr:class I adenylate-forming enzyme family protein [Starkeya sp. ORNL1]QJP14272.1 acyl--CoA ligase [Starkeya sp. ORNL1]